VFGWVQMRRIATEPRAGWQQKVEEAGLAWHSGEQPYCRQCWNESAFYEFTAKEVDLLKAATNELEKMTLAAAQHIIDHRLYSRMGIAESAARLIESSWEAGRPSLYGRFDLAFDGVHPPKLLEYNADTPTALLEAAVVQQHWLQDTFPQRGQFNSIHAGLTARWTELAPGLPGQTIAFCSMDGAADGITVTYLEDTAQQAGLQTSAFPIEEIGWDGRAFVGPDGEPLGAVFKLYPWEWMVREEFGKHLGAAPVLWIEPSWKMLLSNKGILPVLWKLYPRHPNLLEAGFDGPGLMMSWVRKPLMGREGANITIHQPGKDVETGGDGGAEGYIYQELATPSQFDGVYPVIGSWVVGHEGGNAAVGMGVRESEVPIPGNASRFVPHLFD